MILAELLAVASRGDIEPGQVVVLAKVIEIRSQQPGTNRSSGDILFSLAGEC